ncbi:hypothetical protein GA0115255_107545 [Streptomyces sp. Ncost-T6T-2b]|nr:hypothetical protein GA0115255_107545 [Streptomyces sp. Ncost-T6T-2b]
MTSTAPSGTTAGIPDPGQTQARILRVLVASQILSGAGLAAGVTVGALLAQDMLGTTSLAELPSALFTGGSALTAIAVGRISQARGRRPGLAAGYLTGAIGSAGVITAAVLDNPALLFITLWLRPDPLVLARDIAHAEEADAANNPDTVRDDAEATEGRGGVVLGALVMVLTQLVMVAIRTMTPVHMHDHGHSTAASGLVIGIHIGAMYLPSPLTGWLVDRYGRMKIAAASGIILLAAGVPAATAPDDSVAQNSELTR